MWHPMRVHNPWNSLHSGTCFLEMIAFQEITRSGNDCLPGTHRSSCCKVNSGNLALYQILTHQFTCRICSDSLQDIPTDQVDYADSESMTHFTIACFIVMLLPGNLPDFSCKSVSNRRSTGCRTRIYSLI